VLKEPLSVDDERMIRRCFELAREAVAAGSHPFGALLARGDRVLLEARNTVSEDGVTGHAELNLVRHAIADPGRDALSDCTLYTSTEPCAMCAGAIYWARIPRVVFGCSVEALHSATAGTLRLPCRQVFAHGDRPVEVRGPVLEPEALEVHRAFWTRRGDRVRPRE
jgi:tRNA(Arg) A34 adenosine deaminase TadA